ncbi:MAG: LysM peptidoglycan-binding domain-containing protein [Myxococcota bacterium]|nr:LysM peptidoglycan-binding domain-containing protein [Myxococcota bacterium]
MMLRGANSSRRRRRVYWIPLSLLAVGVVVAVFWVLLRHDNEAPRPVLRAERPTIERITIPDEPDIAPPENATPEPAQAPASEAREHLVLAGEYLGVIAAKYDCTVAELKQANKLSSDNIFAGQTLIIPACSPKTAAAAVRASTQPSASAPRRRSPSWRSVGVDTTTLPRLMKQAGFKAPSRFKALVIEITFDSSRQNVIRERAFDYNGSSDDTDGWNPASTIKLYAAIAVLQRIEKMGFSSKAKVTFHAKKPYTIAVADLIRAAIIDSDNIAYNRLVQLASYDYLNGTFLSAENGVRNSALTRAYQSSTWTDMGENVSLRHAPAITLIEGKRKREIEASTASTSVECSAAACTTLQDLAEVTRRLMLQEQLVESDGFKLNNNDLIMLRRAMRAERARGNEMVDKFANEYNDERVRFYSKPGFAGDWFTDNVYIFDPRVNQAWIVTMAGYPGRKSLDSAAQVIAKLVANGELRKLKN